MTERLGPEIETLFIHITVRLQRRRGRKLIATPDGTSPAPRRLTRDETLIKSLVRTPLTAEGRERSRGRH